MLFYLYINNFNFDLLIICNIIYIFIISVIFKFYIIFILNLARRNCCKNVLYVFYSHIDNFDFNFLNISIC